MSYLQINVLLCKDRAEVGTGCLIIYHSAVIKIFFCYEIVFLPLLWRIGYVMDKDVVLDATQEENKKMRCAPEKLTVSYKQSYRCHNSCFWNLSDSFRRKIYIYIYNSNSPLLNWRHSQCFSSWSAGVKFIIWNYFAGFCQEIFTFYAVEVHRKKLFSCECWGAHSSVLLRG